MLGYKCGACQSSAGNCRTLEEQRDVKTGVDFQTGLWQELTHLILYEGCGRGRPSCLVVGAGLGPFQWLVGTTWSRSAMPESKRDVQSDALLKTVHKEAL